MMFRFAYYESPAGRKPAEEYVEALPDDIRAHLKADFQMVTQYGPWKAPVSVRPVKGKAYRGLWEIRTLDQRAVFFIHEGMIVILAAAKKQNEEAAYEAARKRRKLLLGEG